MSDIFISYAREDRERVEPLAKVLEGQGWSVWWDRRIPTGKRFSRVIEEELGYAKAVIVVWSQASTKSDWVLEEAEEGKERDILFPVRIEQVKIPLGFRRLQTIDLIDWRGMVTHPSLLTLVEDLSIALNVPRPIKTATSMS